MRTATTWRIARWWWGANMNPKPTASMHSATAAGSRSIRAPSASSTSAEPERPVAERLPCLATVQPAPAATKRRCRRDVERRAPAARARGVEQVLAVDRDSPGRARASCVRGRRARRTVSPFVRSAIRNARRLRLRRLARHDLAQDRARLVGGQVEPGGEPVDRLGQYLVRHQRAAVGSLEEVAQQRPAVRVRTDSGWNCTPSAGSSGGAGPSRCHRSGPSTRAPPAARRRRPASGSGGRQR